MPGSLYPERVLDIDAQVPNGVLNLRMTQQILNSPQIARRFVDDRRLVRRREWVAESGRIA